MEAQNYASHRRYVVGYHFVLSFLLLVTLIGSCVNLYKAIRADAPLYDAALLLAMVVIASMLYWYTRIFPLKAQDRAIRAEENLRHYVLTGELLDSRLTVRQVVGLRFASDGELPKLAQRAAEENLSENDIKKAIESWRGDDYRV